MRTGPSAEGAAPVRLPFVPKEHGASFMSVHALLLGIVAGLAAGGRDVGGLLLALAFDALFLPLTASISFLSHRRLGVRARLRATVLAGVLVAAGVVALFHGPAPQLLETGGAAAVLAVTYAAARARTGARSVATQLAAIAGISLLAPLTWLLVAGASPRWQLSAIAAFCSFGGTVPYVRERVRRRRFAGLTPQERLRGGLLALGWQAASLAAAGAAAAAGLVNPLVAAAFLPGAVKTLAGIARPESRPPIRRIGYVETGISTAFALLAGIGLGLAPLS
jgi:hypothetical protein